MGNVFSRHCTLALMLLALPSCGDNGSSAPGPQKPDGGGSGSHDAQNGDAGLDGPGADPHLILHYAFEDSATVVTDSSARHKDGTLNAVSGWTADGRVGRALAMTGGNPANVFVSMPNGVLTNVDDFTISFWVKMNTVADWARVYDFGNGLADPQNRFMYFTPAGFSGTPVQRGTMASSYGGAPTNELVALSPTILPTGAWKHVAIVGTSGARTIYVDGYPALKVENGPMVPPREMEPMGNASWLGKGRFPDPGLDGTLDEFMIYDRALTQAEVADLAWPGMDYSYWRFDEGNGGTARDSSDRNIPTALGTGVTWTPGRLGMALDFPGGAAGPTGPTVTLATNPLANCTNELTVAAWIKVDASHNWARVFDFGTSNTRFIYLAPSDGAGMHFAMVSEHGLFDLVAPAPIAADGNWHHVAATVAADGTVKLYTDGAMVKMGSSPMVKPSDFATMSDLWLGKSRFDDPYFDGAIDELRIGCRALTADEIMTLSRR